MLRYVVEYGPTGNLWAIDLTTNTKESIGPSVSYASGLLLDKSSSVAYISELVASKWIVSQIGLTNKMKTPFYPQFLGEISFMHWTDESQTNIIAVVPSYSVVFEFSIQT